MKGPEHAIRRARERYGLTISPEDLEALGKMCRGARFFVEQMPDGSEHHEIEWRNTKIKVVYRPMEDRVVTFLPPNGRFYPAGKVKRLASRAEKRRKLNRLKKWVEKNGGA